MSDATDLRTFGALLAALEGGRLEGDLTTSMKDLLKAMHDVAGGAPNLVKGELVLKVKFAMEDGTLEIEGDVTTKAPKFIRQKSIMWPTPEGFLTRRNPSQPEFAFGVRDVKPPGSREN